MKIEKPKPKQELNPYVCNVKLFDASLQLIETMAKTVRFVLNQKAQEGSLTYGQFFVEEKLISSALDIMQSILVGVDPNFDWSSITKQSDKY